MRALTSCTRMTSLWVRAGSLLGAFALASMVFTGCGKDSTVQSEDSSSSAISISSSESTSPSTATQAPSSSQDPNAKENEQALDSYREALKKAGIPQDDMLSEEAGRYICLYRQSAAKDEQQLLTFVTAMVGLQAEQNGEKLTDDQAKERARKYIKIADAEYCKKYKSSIPRADSAQ